MTNTRFVRLLGLLSLFLVLVTAPASMKAQSIPVWQSGVAYTAGQEVSYNGVDYICLQSHTSEPGWDPPAVPALWSPVSSGSSQCTVAPSAPTGLVASNTTSSGTTLSWGAVTAPANCSIASYTVLQNGSVIGTATGSSLSVTGLAASTTYSFTVEATDADGTSSPSTVVSVTTPAGTTSSGSCGAAWNAATAYTGGMTASENGVNYVANWWTQGQNPASNSGAAGSGEPWTVQGACSSCSQAPPTPTGLSATTTYDSANLSWAATTPPASCTVSYNVQVSGQSSATTSSTSDSVTGLASSTSYTFTVAATDSAGSSSAATGSFTTQANPCNTVPTSAPTNLTSASTTGSSTALSWSAVTAPTNCTISYTITGGPATLTTSNTTDTVSGLTPSTAYTFAVAATDAAGSGPTSTVTVNTTNAPASYFVGGWFEEWGTYYANSNVADLQNSGVVNSLTHVIYAFAKPVSNGSNVVCALADSYADYQKEVPQVPGATAATAPLLGNFGALAQLKQLHPNLKILLSIGGWNPPTYNQLFDTASSTEANRQAFVSSCINMFIQGNIASGVSAPNLFDGFDLDWEFPNANETANFTALLTEFRNELNTLSTSTGETYQLVADLAAGPSTPGAAEFSGNDGGYDTINIAAVSQQLDYLNVDGYNYDGDWTNATNDASALFDEGQDPLYGTSSTKGCNYIDCTVQYYLSQGAPPAKYTMGFPLYGAGWAGGLNSTNSGMYQNATGVTDGSGAMTTNGTSPVPLANGTGLCSTGDNQTSPAAGCDPLLTSGLATYGTLVNMMGQGFTVSFDSTRCATRMFNASTAPFSSWVFSYDDANSVACKVNYIKQYGLGGGYVWALKDDDPSGDLTKTLSSDLNQNQ